MRRVPAALARFQESRELDAKCAAGAGACRLHAVAVRCPPVFRAPPVLRRFAVRLPAWLALLALALRLLLPALHDHRAHRHADGACCAAAAAPGCACGRSHAPKVPAIAAAVDKAAPCLICELELAAPGAPVPVPLALLRPGAMHIRPLLHGRSARRRPRLHRHRARAPPKTTLRRR